MVNDTVLTYKDYATSTSLAPTFLFAVFLRKRRRSKRRGRKKTMNIKVVPLGKKKIQLSLLLCVCNLFYPVH